MVNRIWHKLSTAGLFTNQDPSVKRYIILTNRFAIIIGLMACMIVLIVFHDPTRPGLSSTRIFILLSALIIMSIVWINHLRYYKLAKLLISWVPATLILVISMQEKIFLTEYVNIPDFFTYRFLIMATSIIPVLVYNTSEMRLMIFNLIPSFTGTVLFNPLNQLIGVDFERYGFHIPSLYIMDSIILFAYVGLVGFLMNQRVIFDRFEVSLCNKQSVLEEKNKELRDERAGR